MHRPSDVVAFQDAPGSMPTVRLVSLIRATRSLTRSDVGAMDMTLSFANASPFTIATHLSLRIASSTSCTASVFVSCGYLACCSMRYTSLRLRREFSPLEVYRGLVRSLAKRYEISSPFVVTVTGKYSCLSPSWNTVTSSKSGYNQLNTACKPLVSIPCTLATLLTSAVNVCLSYST
jgi:hypothetical protein